MKAFTVLALAGFIGFGGPAYASGGPPPGTGRLDAAGLAGVWEGTLNVAGRTLRVVFDVQRRGEDAWKATMDSPDQGAHGIPVDRVTLENGVVRFEVGTVRGFFEGRLADGSTLEGTWHQPAGALPLTLRRDAGASATPPPTGGLKPVLGTWEGTLRVSGAALRIVFHIAEDAGGAVSATMDSPDQGARGIPVAGVRVEGDRVTIEVPTVGGSFTGTVKRPGTMAGTWEQSGLRLPLDLERTGGAKPVSRPQEPSRPLPYRAEEVTVPEPAAGLALAGTLTLPPGRGPFPAAVLISGSGPQDRDETVFGHRPFLVLADALTRRGIAVLRMDDRGVGRSTGTFAGATDDDFVGDTLAGVAYLAARPDIDHRAIGLIGHSEGGLVAPKAAARSRDVAFVVLLEAPGVPLRRVLAEQSALILRAGGAGEEAVAAAAETQKRCFAVLDREQDPAKARAAIVEVLWSGVPGRDTLSSDERKAMQTAFAGEAARLTSPWLRDLLDYDPATALARVRCPVLAVGGGKDLQVPAKENLAAIAAALKSGGNRDVTVEELPGLNHLLQPAGTGAPSEYATIETTIAPEALRLIGDWVLAHVPASGT